MTTKSPNATAKDLYQFAGQMMDEYGLSGYEIHPYGQGGYWFMSNYFNNQIKFLKNKYIIKNRSSVNNISTLCAFLLK